MPETITPEQSGPRFSIDLGIAKTLFDIMWKVIPVLWACYHFFGNQDELLKATKSTESLVTTLQTQMNKQDRDLAVLGGKVEALQSQLNEDQSFFLQTRTQK